MDITRERLARETLREAHDKLAEHVGELLSDVYNLKILSAGAGGDVESLTEEGDKMFRRLRELEAQVEKLRREVQEARR